MGGWVWGNDDVIFEVGIKEMMTSDNKVGGWVKKGQNHDEVILEWSLTQNSWEWDCAKNLQETSLKLLSTLLCIVQGLSLELRNAREGFLTNNQMQEYSNIARDAKIHKQTKLLQIVTSIYLHTRNIRTSFRSKVISLVSRKSLSRKQTHLTAL